PKVEEELKVETKVEQGSLNMKKEIKPSPPELKALPSHLKYVFLREDSSNPEMIGNMLTPLEEDKL
ncbi:hypothetical protein A2U01_0073280, partial [Trifolium medium]|nr:hypothetical protein [Trifolium medium]